MFDEANSGSLIALIDAGLHLGFSKRKILVTLKEELGVIVEYGVCGLGVALYSVKDV
jgi:hypothetical protein